MWLILNLEVRDPFHGMRAKIMCKSWPFLARDFSWRPILGLCRSEGFPRTGYFIPGHVGGWGLARLGRPSAGVFPALAWPGQARPF